MGGGSDDEVTAMINDHYNGLLDIAEYWQVGDIRGAHITEIASGTTGESQSAQDIKLVIIGIKHDNLADGSGKAAVTVQTKSTLGTAGYMRSPEDIQYSLWKTSQRRTWCNNEFKSALPDYLQKLIKPVTKVSNRYAYTGLESYRGQTTTIDDVFLLSEFETFGRQLCISSYYGAPGSDGTIYKYMETTSNRSKWGSSSYWWTRSSHLNSSSSCYFIRVYSEDGTAYSGHSDNDDGIAPAFCL